MRQPVASRCPNVGGFLLASGGTLRDKPDARVYRVSPTCPARGRKRETAMTFQARIFGVAASLAVLTLTGILLSDISYAIVDPRISFD